MMDNPFVVTKTDANLVTEAAAKARQHVYRDQNEMPARRLLRQIAQLKRDIKKLEQELAKIAPETLLSKKQFSQLETLTHGSREFVAANGGWGIVSRATASKFASLGLAVKISDGRSAREFRHVSNNGIFTYRLTDKAYLVTGRPTPEELIPVQGQ